MRRAVGIVRVSEVGDRSGESFASPGQQRDRIKTACERDGLTLVETFEELDVSGGRPLAKRPGLLRAVEMVERGEADVIVAAYFDRLVRSLEVQAEVVARVEAAGGRVLALDFGEVTGKTAAQWLSSTVVGTMAEYYRRAAKERTADIHIRAVKRGAPPFTVPRTLGYDRDQDGRLVPNEHAPAISEAFRLRADGATIQEVRDHLARHGLDRSHNGTYTLLRSRLVLGEIHFGDLVNPNAHDPIVDRATWRRVQDARERRESYQRSDRLLARLEVLRCAGCGGRMIASVQRQRGHDYPFYRCGKIRADCPARAAISAVLLEDHVARVVRDALSGLRGRASSEADAVEAEAVLERAQAELDATIRAFTGLEGEPAAIDRLRELRRARDEAREHAERLRGLSSALTVSAADWELLTVVERRGLIRATVSRVVVARGRGLGRVRVELVE